MLFLIQKQNFGEKTNTFLYFHKSRSQIQAKESHSKRLKLSSKHRTPSRCRFCETAHTPAAGHAAVAITM